MVEDVLKLLTSWYHWYRKFLSIEPRQNLNGPTQFSFNVVRRTVRKLHVNDMHHLLHNTVQVYCET
jgi:hypothetical protein